MDIVHLGIDSPFVDFLVAGFERHAPGSNELIQVTRDEPPVRAFEFEGARAWLQPSAENVEAVVARASDADVVVVHAMSDFAALVCARLPADVLLVWSGFGFDYYRGAAGADLYGDRTLALIRQVTRGKQPDPFGRLVREGEPGRLEPLAMELVRQTVASRTDYFSAPVPADLPVFTRAFPGFRGRYMQLNYGDLASMGGEDATVARGDDILVGNSASWSNNHADAFRLLAAGDLGLRRAVVPLTYGDPRYRDAVIRRGQKALGDSFVPIVDHLPIDEYLDLMVGCGSVLFLHRRQQGVGNIVAALQQGSHLLLDRRNPLFGWLRSQGVEVHPAASLRRSLPNGPVSESALLAHRAFLADQWGADRVRANLENMLGELEERVSSSGPRARLRRRFRARRLT